MPLWTDMNWEQRRLYIANMVQKSEVNRRTTFNEEVNNDLDGARDENEVMDENEMNGENEVNDENQVTGENEVNEEIKHKRNSTLKYHLVSNGNKVQVCQKMFLNTLGIKKWTIRYWICGEKHPNSDSVKEANCKGMSLKGCLTRKSTADIAKKTLALEFLNKFFSSLAKLPSHYCRKSTTRLYLEPIFLSMSQLYKIYIERCKQEEIERAKDENTLRLSRYTFEKAFKDANLSLFQPKKDKCDLCSAYEVNNVTEEEYKRHIEMKEEARKEKEADKKKAQKKELHVFTSDLEAVKLAPYLQASISKQS